MRSSTPAAQQMGLQAEPGWWGMVVDGGDGGGNIQDLGLNRLKKNHELDGPG